MYDCKICEHRTKSLKGYVIHQQLHRNDHNVKFPCVIGDCSHTFRSYAAFQTHITRHHHDLRAKPSAALVYCQDYREVEQRAERCMLPFCQENLPDFSHLIAHLRTHIMHGYEVACPFEQCDKKYKVISSFSSHLSRVHKRNVPVTANQDETPIDSECELELMESNQLETDEDSDITLAQTGVTGDELLRALALFYLKLQSKYLLPSSTIQMIIDELQNVTLLGQHLMFDKLKQKLKDEKLCHDKINDIITEVSGSDFFEAAHSEGGPLRSDHIRKEFFKKNLKYVSPVAVNLGVDEISGSQRIGYYVPILQTIKTMVNPKILREQSPQCSQDGKIRHFVDGEIYKQNELFKQNPSALQIVLFQDAFEVSNPLGSAKGKHKLLAVYFTLGNLEYHYRSKIDHLQLVFLCKEKDFKSVSHEVLFEQLLQDLQKLETEGLQFDTDKVYGTVASITGDNLGSHCIGGFTENFSTSQYMCRYCLMTRNDQQFQVPYFSGLLRNPENYEEAVTISAHEGEVHNGVKFQSVFNQLKFYHVCSPGLPPCLAHDIFEGVVQYDLALFIKYFVKTKKWFTYEHLNYKVKHFKYVGNDAKSKPAEVYHSGQKLGGNASQNWCLLRLLPFLIGVKIPNYEDPVWQLFLTLKNIVDIVCAPQTSEDQIAVLQDLISEYLEYRVDLFPEVNLRPKHHYLVHYPWLALQFGPLIWMWTLRFESKHSYFKRTLRYSGNFKNVGLTLSEKHQLLQAYITSSNIFSDTVECFNGIQFQEDLYNAQIIDSIKACQPEVPVPCLVSNRAYYKGTEYKKGQYLVVNMLEDVVLGCILLILTTTREMFFVCQNFKAFLDCKLGLYQLSAIPESISCVHVHAIKDYYPLHAYVINGRKYVSFKHAVLD
ncbi:hypothetical protein HOLleu_21895 [Holothuria leucospilota]|uniref:C2H2-type domain-containing protein n=1 Tax=Holothuria leucospilota TaxID=206669 RepID=A0A9Q1BXW9_HOLLE|nr:hypothetical protein HOLleu_21895 [Holothuria leucospilota]